MSDDYQTTSKSLADRIFTKKERQLYSFLEEGPREYSVILRHLKREKISPSTSNRLLNKMVEENRIFRIKKGKRVFYRINDFPINVTAFLVLLDCAIKDNERVILSMPPVKEGESQSEEIARIVFHNLYQIPKFKQELAFCQALKNNIIKLFPKLDLRKICLFTIAEISASASGNQTLLNFLEGLKGALD